MFITLAAIAVLTSQAQIPKQDNLLVGQGLKAMNETLIPLHDIYAKRNSSNYIEGEFYLGGKWTGSDPNNDSHWPAPEKAKPRLYVKKSSAFTPSDWTPIKYRIDSITNSPDEGARVKFTSTEAVEFDRGLVAVARAGRITDGPSALEEECFAADEFPTATVDITVEANNILPITWHRKAYIDDLRSHNIYSNTDNPWSGIEVTCYYRRSGRDTLEGDWGDPLFKTQLDPYTYQFKFTDGSGDILTRHKAPHNRVMFVAFGPTHVPALDPEPARAYTQWSGFIRKITSEH